MIRDIEQITGRRLVIYFANRYREAQINQRDCTFFAELFGDVGGAPVDLLLETNGGETDATEALIRLLQNLTPEFRVIIPNAAKSNGTLLSLAARSIIMGAASELGPIEPSMSGIPVSVLMQPEMAQQNYPLHKLAEFAHKHSMQIARDLLAAGMMHGVDVTQIDAVVAKLAGRGSYFSHGSVIDHREAAALGLNVEYLPPDSDLWCRIWLLYCMYEHDVQRDGYLKVFEGRARSTAVNAPS